MSVLIVVSLRFIRLRKKRPPDFQTAFLLKVNDEVGDDTLQSG